MERKTFTIGPDWPNDFRLLRPYFLVPLDRDGHRTGGKAESGSDDLDRVFTRIREYVSKRDQNGQGVSDIYLFSHGWHRNFFSAVAAYDRLISSFLLLAHRGRITFGNAYRPLFLAFHWHSDPGEDRWVDKEGRRHLPSFLDNVTRIFEQPAAEEDLKKEPSWRFMTVFEDLFEYFARLSAPDTDEREDESFGPKSDTIADLARRFSDFRLREAPNATMDEKVTAAWACYQTSLPRRRLIDQTTPPGPFLGLRAAVANLLQFTVKAIGITACIALLLKARGVPPAKWLVGLADWGWQLLRGQMGSWGAVGVIGITLFVLAAVHLRRTAPNGRGNLLRPPRSVSVLRLAAWLYLQVVCTLPLALYALVTYFLGGLFRHGGKLRGLFDERFGARGSRGGIGNRPSWSGPRYYLAQLARFPIRLLRLATPRDSSMHLLADQLENQLAFWQMQFRGVEAGKRGAVFLTRLREELPSLANARIHLIGHSFGGLVVSNLVRHLALESKRPVNTLCLLQGALGSAWFEDETEVLQHVKDVVACIFSRYDTANSFYYPVANHGRLAAGAVGILDDKGEPVCRIPNNTDKQDEDRGRFASVTTAPPLFKLLQDRVSKRSEGFPWIVNLDASRMIYNGNVLTGGGHGDIFKNDVVLLIWATTEVALRGGRDTQ